MKKIIISGLLTVLFGSFSLGLGINNTHAEEPTSGSRVDSKVQTRVLNFPQNVGGGTWTSGNPTGSSRAVSRYYHRSNKHSATVTGTNRSFRATRGAGTLADASLPYKAGTNAYYWNNAPTSPIGDSASGGF
ncbi:hypothetical protein A5881_003940 [Enterococcus termitis]|nr:hypothetical protein A5881_003836 [Enterococcus termitis]